MQKSVLVGHTYKIISISKKEGQVEMLYCQILFNYNLRSGHFEDSHTKANLQRKIVVIVKKKQSGHIQYNFYSVSTDFSFQTAVKVIKNFRPHVCCLVFCSLCICSLYRFMPCFLNDLKITLTCLLGSYSLRATVGSLDKAIHKSVGLNLQQLCLQWPFATFLSHLCQFFFKSISCFSQHQNKNYTSSFWQRKAFWRAPAEMSVTRWSKTSEAEFIQDPQTVI